MKPTAKAFAASVILLGALALVQSYLGWHSESVLRFFIYLFLTIVGSGLKITLPTVRSTMSVNFFFVLVAIAQLSLGETVTIGVFGFLTQYLWKSKSRPKVLQVSFNLSTAALAAATSWHVFHWPLLRDAGLEFPLMMTAAAIAYFITNTCPVAIIIGLTEEQPVHQVWRDCYLWAFPYYLLGAAMAGAFDWGSKTAGWQVAVLGLPSLYLIYSSYNSYLKRLEDEKRHAQQQREHAESISELHLRTIEALALAIEAKDQTTHDHLARVQVYALEIGRELKLGELDLEALRAASLLHDIGKLAVPEHIISKPGRLTPEEFEKMKIHPTVGAEILEHVRFPYPVVPIVRAHHEKWDGSGYPAGLKGEEIPLGARILTAVDCLDALASDRQYRRALPIDEAMAYVVREAGKSFDPAVVEILERRHLELEAKARAEGAAPRPRLSTDVKVERGEAPAAGFESIEALPLNTTARATEFVDRIGAARQEAQVLFEVTGDMGSSLSLDATLSILASGLAKLVPFGGMAVYLRRANAVRCEFAMGEGARLFSSLEIPIGQGLSGWVAENQKPIVNGNPAVEPGYLNDTRKFTTLRSALAVPIEGASGPIGVLTLYDSAKDAFTRDHLRVVLAISSRLGVSIENALKYRQAEDGAVLDYLTQLPNARALFVRLQEEVQNCTLQKLPLTVLVGDLDGFKSVNDHHGHLEGNRLLQVLAAALKAQCRPQDYVARMGGDEFAIILHGAGSDDAVFAASRYRDAVVNAVTDQPQFSHVSLSLGAATLGEDGEHPEELLAAADRRMYKVKSDRKKSNADLIRLTVAIRDETRSSEVSPVNIPVNIPVNVQCGV